MKIKNDQGRDRATQKDTWKKDDKSSAQEDNNRKDAYQEKRSRGESGVGKGRRDEGGKVIWVVHLGKKQFYDDTETECIDSRSHRPCAWLP